MIHCSNCCTRPQSSDHSSSNKIQLRPEELDTVVEHCWCSIITPQSRRLIGVQPLDSQL